jgi:hypothetical protein
MCVFKTHRFSNDHYVDGLQNVPMQRPQGGMNLAQVGIVRTVGLVEAGPHTGPNSVNFGVFAVRNSVRDPDTETRGRATGRELYVVEAGRHNCFEAIVLFLIQMVKLLKISVRHITNCNYSGEA